MKPLLFTGFHTFWYETYRALSQSAYGGADIGEVLTAAEAIIPGNYESWHLEWLHLAERLEADARLQLRHGHKVSARDGLLRAATYFFSAEFFLRDEHDDPRISVTYERGSTSFRDAMVLFGFAESIDVPFEGATLNGYFYRGSGEGPRPTVIWHNGFDGSAEEMFSAGGLAGVERGYNVVIFDGPGQPGPRIRAGLTFRPDWERPVGAVIDYLQGRAEVDRDRIALAGNSMGGLLAPRAAAFEPRVSAVITLDGVYDFSRPMLQIAGIELSDVGRLMADDDPALDQHLSDQMMKNDQIRWAMRQGMWAFREPTPRRFIAAALPYHLRDGIAERVTCPAFVGWAETDQFFEGQPEELVAHLTNSRADLVHFTDSEGAGAHAQVGGGRLMSQRVFDWLDDTYGTTTG